MLKEFYDKHRNFSCRTLTEYDISPGIKCKFDLLKANLNTKKLFTNALDLGSSGNSFLFLLENMKNKSFLDIAESPLKQLKYKITGHPVCSDLKKLPYRNRTFDFISALDVLEHVKDDQVAVSEISRILKNAGIAVITVPHGKRYYTNQDRIIGHYRRYEVNELVNLFEKFNLKHLKTFGIYGRLMRVSDIQSVNPNNIEERLANLRYRYENNHTFRKIWNVIVKIISKLMKIEAKHQSIRKVMNIALIFRKNYDF
ncbi:MAG: class I SAM-dependent methyltransferase [Promethearchaeota archaeon]|jgi:SAM-dependent methyltransferase